MINGFMCSYTGIVDIIFQRNNEQIKKVTIHNAGLDALFMSVCKALAGYSIQEDRPVYVDLRKGPFTSDSGTSILSKRVSVSGASYSFDSDLNKWVCKLSATISYADILSPAELSSENELRLYLTNGKKTPSDLAYLVLKEEGASSSELDSLKPGTQALIQWKMCFGNSVTMEE